MFVEAVVASMRTQTPHGVVVGPLTLKASGAWLFQAFHYRGLGRKSYLRGPRHHLSVLFIRYRVVRGQSGSRTHHRSGSYREINQPRGSVTDDRHPFLSAYMRA